MTGIFVQEHAKAVQLFNNVAVFHSIGTQQLNQVTSIGRQELNHPITKGIPTYHIKYKLSSTPILSFWYKFRQHWLSLRHISKNGFRPDLIHAHIYNAGFIGVLLGKLFRIPVLITEQSSGFVRKLLSNRGLVEAKFAFRHADLVLPVSLALKKDIEAYGISGSFHCVPNVVDSSLFCRSHHSVSKAIPHFLSVGSQVPVKGINFLLEAFAQVSRSTTAWHLDVIGDGSERSNYEQLASTLNLEKQIKWHGLLSKPSIAEYMQRASCLIVSSLHETFSAVAVESLSCGTPVLATRCGGPEEFINSGNGLLVERGDSHTMAQGILWMIEHESQFDRNQIAQQAYKQFSTEAVGSQLNVLYRQVMSK